LTVLNPANDGLLSVLVVICKALRRWGPLTEAELEALVAPKPIVADASKFTRTLGRWTKYGMFKNTGDKVALAVEPPPRATDDDYIESLRTQVLDILLAEENVPHLQRRDEKGDEEEDKKDASRATDFARVSSWSLLQSPFRFAGCSYEQLQDWAKAQGPTSPIFSGDGILNGFREWAHFTGLGVPTPRGFVLCPARALRVRLDDLLPRGRKGAEEQVSLVDFLTGARRLIPVLPGGRYSDVMVSELARPERSYGETDVAPALSLALMQLQHEGEIHLTDREGEKTPHFNLLRAADFTTWQRYSHVRRSQPLFERRRGN
jgi:hypothetical protein